MVKPPISEEILIEDLVRHYPRSSVFLMEQGLQCIVCGEPVWGNLRELAKDKNFPDDQIKTLVADLEAFVNE